MKIGIFGGTFNPVHQGHLLLAEGAHKELHLDRISWIPAHSAPHKGTPQGATPEDRCSMVELAIQGKPYFQISRCELDRAAPSYTIDTVHQLQKEFPEVSWFLLIGSDTALELSGWRSIEELARLVQFITVPRPGRPPAKTKLKLPYPLWEIPIATLNISSSEIRQRVREGQSIHGLVPASVEQYIRERKLYLT